jgi:hypothetical protein
LQEELKNEQSKKMDSWISSLKLIQIKERQRKNSSDAQI